MYSNILLVGGGLMFEGVESLLQYRVWLNLPPNIRHHTNVTVISRSKVCQTTQSMAIGVSYRHIIRQKVFFHSYVTSSHNNLQVAELCLSCSSL